MVAWGWNDSGQSTVPAGLANVRAISAGYAFSLALVRDGTGPELHLTCLPDRLLPCAQCNTDPASTGSSKARQRNSVDFPDPDGPMIT